MKNLILVVLLSALVLPAQSVTTHAEEEVRKDKQEDRVKEAKKLILEREKIERRLEKIGKRLKELDGGAAAQDPDCSGCIIFSNSMGNSSTLSIQ